MWSLRTCARLLEGVKGMIRGGANDCRENCGNSKLIICLRVCWIELIVLLLLLYALPCTINKFIIK